MLTGACQLGIKTVVLLPPLLARSPCPVVNQFHTVSDSHVPSAPLVLNVVAPTTVIFGSSAGGLTAPV